MTAFDTDVLSDILRGRPDYVVRVNAIPANQQFVPIVVVEEALDGWLLAIRQARSGQGKLSLEQAYARFEVNLNVLSRLQKLNYTAASDGIFKTLKAAKLGVGSQDLRIAAIAMSHQAKLVTRNAGDFRLIPGLNLEIWP